MAVSTRLTPLGRIHTRVGPETKPHGKVPTREVQQLPRSSLKGQEDLICSALHKRFTPVGLLVTTLLSQQPDIRATTGTH